MQDAATMDDYDIAIVGAGPAGALCAWLLAGSSPDRRIVLLDAEAAPRHRPCGEYLSPGGLGVLARAGLLDTVCATGAKRLTGLALRGPHGGHAVPYRPILGLAPPVPFGLGVRRERLDLALQEAVATRCRLLRQARVNAMRRVGDGWELGTIEGHALRARLVIGADGRGSMVRRTCGLDRRPSRLRFALVARAHGVEHGEAGEMHLGPLGQVGLCPLGDGEVNLNLLLAPASGGLLRRMPRDRLLRAALAATPGLAGRTRHAILGQVMATGSLPQGCRSIAADGVALVGDAGGFCDPFTGEGMSLALRGAELLAGAISDGRGLAGYAADFSRAIGRRRRIGELLQGLIQRRRLAEGLAAGIDAIPLLNRLLVADAAGYRRT
jgi:flavin-dependent dehydrogenase